MPEHWCCYFTSANSDRSRLIAIIFAMGITWAFSRAVTFGRSRFPLLLEGACYGSVGLLSAPLNYLIYAGLLLKMPGRDPPAVLVVASLTAMMVSWAGCARFVFKK